MRPANRQLGERRRTGGRKRKDTELNQTGAARTAVGRLDGGVDSRQDATSRRQSDGRDGGQVRTVYQHTGQSGVSVQSGYFRRNRVGWGTASLNGQKV